MSLRWPGLLAVVIAALLTFFAPGADARADESAKAPMENPYPGRFPAPSLDGGTEWLNTSGEISLQDLRGKIVLLDFWTYCCINCIHILPDLKYLEKKYPDQLVVIGVHSAKFDNEKDSENIREAIVRYEIEHPVVNDSNMIIARKYAFSSWPTLVLIDPEGNFVGRQPGEGTRDLFDSVIGQLVAFHRAKGTLDESPVLFHLERDKKPITPLKYPGKVLADAAGQRLFISDSNHNRIVVSSLNGELIDVIGSGQIGKQDGGYDVATFDHPQGMTLVDDVLYVADTENHLIRKIDLKERQVTTLAGVGEQSRTREKGGRLLSLALNSPWALQHLNGTLYVAMAGPHQLWSHQLGSNRMELFAGTGREDITDGPRDQSALAQPSAIVTDGEFLYIVDSEGSAIRRVDPKPRGRVTTIVGPHDLPNGRALFEFGDIDGVGDTVRLQHPIGLAYHDGSLYVADTYNNKIKRVDIATREATTWLGTERGAGLNPVQLYEPAGLTIAGDDLYIADTNNHRILKANLQTKETTEFVVAGLQPPRPVAPEQTDTYLGTVEQVPATTIQAAGELTVSVDFTFPPEYKLNELAPVGYRLAEEGTAGLIAPEALAKRGRVEGRGSNVVLSIPLSGNTGSSTLTLTVAYQFCRDGTGGVCRFGEQRFSIPLTVAENGEKQIPLRILAHE